MSQEINVLSRTQVLEVDPVKGTVSVTNAGPQGPAGPPGPDFEDFSEIDGRLDVVEADNTAQDADIAALQADHTRKEITKRWWTTGDWSDYTMNWVTQGTDPVNGVTQESSGLPAGIGTIHATSGTGGNDRRLYLLNSPTVTDVEVYVDASFSATEAQVGIPLRASSSICIMAWTNVVFALQARAQPGVWEYNGINALETNQNAEGYAYNDLFCAEVISAVGSGGTVTVKTRTPHNLRTTDWIQVFPVGHNGVVASVVDAFTFTYANAASGSLSATYCTFFSTIRRRKLAARLVGSKLSFKQWMPWQPEPSWGDVNYGFTVQLPATMPVSGAPLPTSGKIGLLCAHLASSRSVSFNDFHFRHL